MAGEGQGTQDGAVAVEEEYLAGEAGVCVLAEGSFLTSPILRVEHWG